MRRLFLLGLLLTALSATSPVRSEDAVWVLEISPSAGGAHKLGGAHALLLQPVDLDGVTWLVGCVPCFAPWTVVSVRDGKAFALSGYTREFRGALRLRGAAPVEDGDTPNSASSYALLKHANAMPQCQMLVDERLAQRVAATRERGVCFNAP